MSRLASAVGYASHSTLAGDSGDQSWCGRRDRSRPRESLVGDELQDRGCGLN